MPLTTRQVRQAHGRVAIFLSIFIAVHFATHFTALLGPGTHGEALGIARLVYQFPLFELALVAALAVQVILGIKLLTSIRKRKIKGRWHWVQFLSGCYLAYFIVQHTAAALITRLYVGLDTDFNWAAGSLAFAPLKFYFALYYALAVIAIISHMIAALHFRGRRAWHILALALGPLFAALFVAGYGGTLGPHELPQEYRDYYAVFPGVGP